jgi:hypothetical protein
MSYPFILQGNNLTVVIDNKIHTVSKSHITFDQVINAIKAQDWDAVKTLIEPVSAVLSYGKGNITIKGETMFWKGKEFHGAISRRMIDMLREGFTIEPLVLFMENLMQNPSHRSVTELYGFLEKNNLPITSDGHFLAYKKVRDNYFDCHSGTMDNSVGKIVEMERHEVDDNCDNTCSHGLHACSIGYLKSFGGDRTVIVKINPRDAVSVPTDYSGEKLRTCRYEVIGEVEVDPNENTFTRTVQDMPNQYDDSEEDYYDEWEDDFGNDDVLDESTEEETLPEPDEPEVTPTIPSQPLRDAYHNIIKP